MRVHNNHNAMSLDQSVGPGVAEEQHAGVLVAADASGPEGSAGRGR